MIFADLITGVTYERMCREGWDTENIAPDGVIASISKIIKISFKYQKQYATFTFTFDIIVDAYESVKYFHLFDVQWAMMMKRLEFERMIEGYPAFCCCSYAPNPACLYHGATVRKHLVN